MHNKHKFLNHKKMTVTCSHVANDLWLCRLHETSERRAKPKVRMMLVVDNSGSMGSMTRELTRTIGKEMFRLDPMKIDMLPGTLMLFDADAHIASDSIHTPNDLDKIRFPNQGCTNITQAIETTVAYLISIDDSEVHNVVVFLSDGQHNQGPELDDRRVQLLRRQVDAASLKLSIVVVGIASSDTKLGMMIKSGLETVPMRSMETIYYTQQSSRSSGQGVGSIDNLLATLNRDCTLSLCAGSMRPLSLLGEGVFLDNDKRQFSAFAEAGQAQFIVRSKNPPRIALDGQVLNAEIVQPSVTDITAVVNHIMIPLSQRRIALGTESIRQQVQELQKMIDTAEVIHAKLNSAASAAPAGDIGQVKLTPSQRLQMIRKTRQSKTLFQEERNRLQQLLVAVENDSAKQAQFLTGMSGKYAGKAVLKSGTMEKSLADILIEMKQFVKGTAFQKALTVASRSTSENSSVLSLNTSAEQLMEWEDAATANNYADLYSVLVAFGMTGYSVLFEHSNAAQMDPFQTTCKSIEPSCFVDSASVLLANQLGRDLKSPAGLKITDCLVLIDPACPEACRLAMQSPAYQYLCSVTLCRDLYMYHPKMTFSMHAHALLKCMDLWSKEKSSAYLSLALRILYSIRRFWGDRVLQGENVDLFKRWFVDWESITQSERDSCNHPVQLLLLLGALDLRQLGINYESTKVPLVNLCNEALARWMKQRLHILCEQRGVQRTSAEMNAIALELMHKLFDITADNSPKSNPEVLEQEPSIESIRQTCQIWADVSKEFEGDVLSELQMPGIGIGSAVQLFCRPWVLAFRFGIAVQEMLLEKGKSWEELAGEFYMAADVPNAVVDDMSQRMSRIDPSLSVQFDFDPHHLGNYQCMLLQAVMNHDSSSRSGTIMEKDVLDSDTFHNLVVDLRMAHYMNAFNVKKQHWLSIIGDVTLAEALSENAEHFRNLIGQHTHGLCKDKFWALFKAALQDNDKRKIFLEKSAESVENCFKHHGQ